MKKYFFSTISMLILCSTVVLSQEVPRKAARIILTNTLSKEENYREVGRILLDNDFIIDYSDKELGFLNTAPNDTRTTISKLRIVVRDKEVILSGKCKYSDRPDAYVDLINTGINGIGCRSAFNKMHDLALKIPHDKVDYGLTASK